MSDFHSNIVDESKNIFNDQTIDSIKDMIDPVSEISDTKESQVNNIIIVKPTLPILLPESPKEIEDNNIKAFNDIPKQKKEVINSIGNEITKKIEELDKIKSEELDEIKSEEILYSKKKNTWLWWWPW